MELETPEWIKDAVFYQIFPDRFAQSARVAKPGNLQAWEAAPTYHAFKGGDLLGVLEKLDYLSDLGINAIYFTPIFASAANHRYHTYDYYQVDPILGGNAAFKELLTAAHQKGIRIILDGVFNHASRGFFQFNHLMECGRESPYVDWFTVYDWPVNAFHHDQKPSYQAWWNLHALPKFNTHTPAVREFLWDVATYWLEQGVDGWRLDVPGEIDDDSFWREFRRRCKAVNPETYIVGELWHEAHRWLQGDQFDAQMNYLFTRAAFGFFVGRQIDQAEVSQTGYGHIPTLNAAQFAAELNRLHKLYHPQVVQAQLNVLGSHDTPRLMTVANQDPTAVRLLFLCQMTVAGAPNIYYGDEIGMTGGRDPDNRRAFPWGNEERWDKKLLADVRRFVALRHATPALRRGTLSIVHTGDNLVAYRRDYEGQTAVVAFNVGTLDESFTMPADLPQPLREALVDKGVKVVKAEESVLVGGRCGRVWVS